MNPILVNLGSGPYPLAGWVNVDIDPSGRPEVLADLSRPLPFRDASVDYIHTEDFIAQLPPDGLERFFVECKRVLRPGGVVRVLTPDLERLMRTYLERPDHLLAIWHTAVGVPLPIGEAADVVNLGMQLAGRWQYDFPSLARVAARAGFDCERVAYNTSRHAPLNGVDLRNPDEAVSLYAECTPRTQA
jgi:SAM-dependent methyltransferase